jgi:pimeloyl-ACP methyl ester carboxylesterase
VEPRVAAASPPDLAVHREGNGPALLLLHGIGSDRREFTNVLPALTGRYDVLAVDLPGHGGSPALPADTAPDFPTLADAVERALDRAGVPEPHVLGVSIGGRVALELARRGRARSVVAVAPTGPVLPAERAHQVALLGVARLAYQGLDRVADAVLRVPSLRAAALSPLRARGWRTTPQEAVALVQGFSRADGYWRSLRHAVLPEATVDFTSVRCPVVLAQGTHDVISLGQVLRLVALVPGARFRLLPAAGHSAVGDVPDEVVRLVDEVAARSAPQPTALATPGDPPPRRRRAS